MNFYIKAILGLFFAAFFFSIGSLTSRVSQPVPIPKEITRNTSFKELTELRHGEFSYLSAVSNYYYTHFPQKEADKCNFAILSSPPKPIK